MVEVLLILTFLIIIVACSEYSKSYHVSLFLGMIFVIFSWLIIRTLPHFKNHTEKYSFSHFFTAIVDIESNSSKVKCFTCKGNDIMLTFIEDKVKGTMEVEIKCNECKVTTNAQSLKQALESWKLKK